MTWSILKIQKITFSDVFALAREEKGLSDGNVVSIEIISLLTSRVLAGIDFQYIMPICWFFC